MTTTAAHTAPDATTYVLDPISPAEADALRATGGRRYVADAKPGFPCRQCLRDAELGEELILVSHDPFDRDSPYRSASPIFLHLEPCGGPVPAGSPSDRLPAQLTGRQLSVRAFDEEAMMVDATVIDGTVLSATLDRLLADPATSTVHVHFAQRGCWATRVTRPGR